MARHAHCTCPSDVGLQRQSLTAHRAAAGSYERRTQRTACRRCTSTDMVTKRGLGHAACRAAAAKAADRASSPRSADSAHEQLQQWAQQAGIVAAKLRPAEFAGLRGMAAREGIAAGEVLASVPVGAALVVSPKERCALPRDFCEAASYARQPWYVQMALKLLHERRLGAASRLGPYVAALPRSFATPLGWSAAQLDALRYPRLQQQVAKQQEGLRRLALELRAATPGTAVTEADLAWALQAVRSRAFSGPYAGPQWKGRLKTVGAIGALAAASDAFAHVPVEQVLNGVIAAALFNVLYDVALSQKVSWYAMCPVIDFLNHSSRVESEVEYEYFADRFSVRCQAGFSRGEQVFISYGCQSNDSLLQYYGFVDPGNSHDTYVIPDLSRSALLRHSTKAASNLPAALLSAKPEIVLTRQGPDSKTVERLQEGGLTTGQIKQLVMRVCEEEVKALRSEVAADHDMARAFRREKAAVLQSVLAKAA